MFITVLNIYARKRALSLYFQEHTISSIVVHLCLEDRTVISKQGLRKFLKCYTEQGTIEIKQAWTVAVVLEESEEEEDFRIVLTFF